eukprot:TRINITY_DN56844_c0_g1_i1.p1 TRINITY_DN56844_c0_g1~~TRINITY_DN56844_c0_g1_i1.p1  ORF type:complete len:325 (-),score=50.41 TRINITY_DN56844_c0_g1_i1:158-1132(-)
MPAPRWVQVGTALVASGGSLVGVAVADVAGASIGGDASSASGAALARRPATAPRHVANMTSPSRDGGDVLAAGGRDAVSPLSLVRREAVHQVPAPHRHRSSAPPPFSTVDQISSVPSARNADTDVRGGMELVSSVSDDAGHSVEAANSSLAVNTDSAGDLLGRSFAKWSLSHGRDHGRAHKPIPWQALVAGSAGFSLAEAAFAGTSSSDSDSSPRQMEDSSASSKTQGFVSSLIGLIIVGAAVAGGMVMYKKHMASRAAPGRLNEVPRNSGGADTWTAAKARQTYRKSVLEAQAKNTDSEDEADVPQLQKDSGTGSSTGQTGGG